MEVRSLTPLVSAEVVHVNMTSCTASSSQSGWCGYAGRQTCS